MKTKTVIQILTERAMRTRRVAEYCGAVAADNVALRYLAEHVGAENAYTWAKEAVCG